MRMLELCQLLLATLPRALRSRRHLLLENLLLRQQLQVARRPQRRPRLQSWDKLFWLLIRRLHRGWRRELLLVRPETIIRWHRRGWRLYWRWRSGWRPGRPRLKPEVRELIRTMAHENRLWGTQRIRGELLKLGIVVSARSRSAATASVAPRVRPARAGVRSSPTTPARSGRPIFVVQTLTFQTLYVIFFISHGRRQLLHFEVTAHPSATWVWRQLIEATPWDCKPDYLIHDRDRVWGGNFAVRAAAIGITSLLTPVRAPNANSIGERVVGTLRRECLDHLIILGERHLRAVLAEFVSYYHRERPHRSLRLGTPVVSARSSGGEVQSRPILGGLHHVYQRAV